MKNSNQTPNPADRRCISNHFPDSLRLIGEDLDRNIEGFLRDCDRETVETIQYMYMGWLESGLSNAIDKMERTKYYHVVFGLCNLIQGAIEYKKTEQML